jgi:hypothetical protein
MVIDARCGGEGSGPGNPSPPAYLPQRAGQLTSPGPHRECRAIRTVSLRREDFPDGSMGPKVEAVCRFVELTGDMAGIGALTDAELILNGKAGTIVTPGGDYGGPHDLKPPAARGRTP